MNNSVTQKQIAQRLGISPGMVGRVLRNDPAYSAKTSEGIRKVAREMGYHAGSNHEARSLIARRYGQTVQHGVIGFRPPHLNSRAFPYYVHLLEGVRDATRCAGVELMLLDAPSTPAWSKVDGFIGSAERAYLPDDHVLHSMPRVGVECEVEGATSVIADDFGGARAATEYLLGLGHRRIAYLIDLHVGHPQAVARVGGYRLALHDAGIEGDNRWIGPLVIDAAQFVERGRDSMKTWLAGNWNELGCTALLVQNDRAAMGAMEVLQDAGIKVPDDVSVVGFDSTDECELIKPRLTSVHVPLKKIGEKAVELLLRQINDENAVPETVTLPVELEIRDSTAPPLQLES